MLDCGVYSFIDALAIQSARFWAKNSYEHIDVLLNSAGPNGAILYDTFEETLKKLFKEYKEIYDELGNMRGDKSVCYLIKKFISINDYFIVLLERLKFEGFNGFPILFETTYHFIYEQKYIKEIFKPMLNLRDPSVKDVLITTKFRPMGVALQCIYSQIYFWSIIGAEHPSIITNITATELQQLPERTREEFRNMTNAFNNIAYRLSSIYPKLNDDNMLQILTDFEKVNRDFLTLLNRFKNDPTYLPQAVKSKLPDLFYGVLEHIIDEHKYADELCDCIMKNYYQK